MWEKFLRIYICADLYIPYATCVRLVGPVICMTIFLLAWTCSSGWRSKQRPVICLDSTSLTFVPRWENVFVKKYYFILFYYHFKLYFTNRNVTQTGCYRKVDHSWKQIVTWEPWVLLVLASNWPQKFRNFTLREPKHIFIYGISWKSWTTRPWWEILYS